MIGDLRVALASMIGSAFAGTFRRALRRARGAVLLGMVVLAGLVAAMPGWARGLLLAALLIGAAVGLERARRQAPPGPVAPVRWDEPLGFVYRWYDRDGRLLYVGRTNDVCRRTEEHADEKPWLRAGVHGTVEVLPSRAAACDVEKVAIRTEQPLYNIVHNSGARR